MRGGLIALALFLLSFSAYCWLTSEVPGNPQAVTRLGLAFSIIERGSLDIDPYQDWTPDKAVLASHVYADKPPGVSFLALPAALLAHLSIPGDSADPKVFSQLARFTTAGTAPILSALAAAALFLLALRLGATIGGAFFGSVALAFATPFFGWSTTPFAHAITGDFLVYALTVLAYGFTGTDRWLPRSPLRLGLGYGALLGFTLVIDLTAAPAVAALGLLGLWLGWRDRQAGGLRFAAAATVGGLLGLAPLPIYNALAFGSPFVLGYTNVSGFEGMRQGLFGIGTPDPGVAAELLFGLYRGLLPLSPILLLVPLGLWRMWRDPLRRLAAGVIVFTFLSWFWINASYVYWQGGWSTGPRHLVATLPFLAMALAFAWPQSRAGRIAASALLAASLALSLFCVVTSMYASQDVSNPLVDYLLPLLKPRALLRAVPIVLVWALLGYVWYRLANPDGYPIRRLVAGSK